VQVLDKGSNSWRKIMLVASLCRCVVGSEREPGAGAASRRCSQPMTAPRTRSAKRSQALGLLTMRAL
jgi:hypothetical protein